MVGIQLIWTVALILTLQKLDHSKSDLQNCPHCILSSSREKIDVGKTVVQFLIFFHATRFLFCRKIRHHVLQQPVHVPAHVVFDHLDGRAVRVSRLCGMVFKQSKNWNFAPIVHGTISSLMFFRIHSGKLGRFGYTFSKFW